MTIEPASGLSRPTRVFRNTDLPVPDGPSITEISPAGSVRGTSFQLSDVPKDLVSPSTAISTPTEHPSSPRQTASEVANERASAGLRAGSQSAGREGRG